VPTPRSLRRLPSRPRKITPAVSTLLTITQQRITADAHTSTYAYVGSWRSSLSRSRSRHNQTHAPTGERAAAVATVLVLVATGVALGRGNRQQGDVGDARRVGVESIGLTGTIQATAYRAKSAESLALIGSR